MTRRSLLAVLLSLSACAPGNQLRKPAAGGPSAMDLYLDGRSAAAHAAFEATLAQHPDDGEALYGLALFAHESGDLEHAWDLWCRLLTAAEGSHDPRWTRLATAAARRLETLVGEVPGEKRLKLEERLRGLHAARLPFEARRRVAGLRAVYARRRGDEAEGRRLDREAGCPDRWFVAGPYGHLPRLDLSQPFAPDEAQGAVELREAPTRACEVILDGPHAHAGVMYALGSFRATHDQRAVLIVESDVPWRLTVDGQPLFSELDEDRYPPHTRELTVDLKKGEHSLALKVSAPGGRAEIGLEVLPINGGEPSFEFSNDRNKLHVNGNVNVNVNVNANVNGLDELLLVEELIALGDIDPAEMHIRRVLARSPRFAPAYLLAAQVALEDPSRPSHFAQDRARRALERALSLDPTMVRARYMRALMSLNADRAREALGRLAEAPKNAPPYWRFAFARYQALKARGWLREAEEALVEARRLHPEGCAPLEAEVALKRERHDVIGVLPLAKLAAMCTGGSDELADALREAGDVKGAVAEYRRLVALDPTREAFRSGLAESLAQDGQVKEAAQLFAELASRYPRATVYRRQLADARVSLGDEAGARKALEEGLGEVPESQDLHRALQSLCDFKRGGTRPCSVMDPFRVDGRQVIAAYEAGAKDRAPYRSPAVIVLDRTVTRVFPTGARLTLTHNVIQVLAKDGIDKWGEVQIPEGADVLTLRAVKADGSTREPEEIAEKETVSVPDLEPGDYVEFEYIDPASPPGAFPSGFIAERFFFRSFDAPLDRTEYLLVTPAGMAVQVDARGDAPAMTLEAKGGLDWRGWAGRDRPQAFQEPSSTPYSEILPSVRAASGVSFQAWKDYLRDTEFGVQRANAELREVAARETAGKRTVEEKVAALDTWVRRHIKAGGQLDEPATSVLAREEGNRVTLLQGLLRAAAVPSEIWLARPQGTAVLDGQLPDLEAFDQALLHVSVPGHEQTLDPRYRHSPTGFVTPVLRGAAALRLAPGPWKASEVGVPNPDDRHMQLDARLELDGSAEVTVREQLRGWPALEWREALEKLPADRVRPEFEQRTLGFYFPGSTLKELTWSGENDDSGLFTVEYHFRSPTLARRIGKRLVLPAPYPAMLGRRYVGVAVRRTPLSIEYAAPTVLSARIALPAGVEVDLPPAAKADGFGAFEQTTEKTPSGLELKARFSMPRGRVQPERYREFVDFATRVDRAEARSAEIHANP